MDKPNPVKKDPLILLGERLKLARENRSLDIEQVQKQTHINSRVIIALEEGRCDELLTPTYVRAFLKKYSQFLGLDPKEMLKSYSSVYSEEPGSHLTIGPETVSYPVLRRSIYAAFFFLAALLILFAVVWMGNAVKKSIMAKKSARPQSVLAKSANAKAARDRSVRVEKKTSRPIEKAAAAKTAAAKKGPFTLVLKTKKTVFIKAGKDGSPLFSRVFSKGSSESIKADERVELYIAEAESVELVLNGRSIGSPGRGTIKNLEVTSEGVKIK